MADASSPAEVLDLFSDQLVPNEARQQLNQLLTLSDELLFLDDTGELAADRTTVIRIARDLIPESLRDIAIVETSKHLSRRIKGKKSRSRPLKWQDGANYGLPAQPASETELRSAGILEATTIEQLDAALRARYERIPTFWTETDPSQLQDEVIKKFSANQTVWDCLVRNLGFWAALTVIGSIVVFLALVAEIGWQAALAVAIVYSGFITAYIAFQCIANTSYSF